MNYINVVEEYRMIIKFLVKVLIEKFSVVLGIFVDVIKDKVNVMNGIDLSVIVKFFDKFIFKVIFDVLRKMKLIC